MEIKELRKIINQTLVIAEHTLRDSERLGLKGTPKYVACQEAVNEARKTLEELPDA